MYGYLALYHMVSVHVNIGFLYENNTESLHVWISYTIFVIMLYLYIIGILMGVKLF